MNSRREFLGFTAASMALGVSWRALAGEQTPSFKLATFSVDVTPPIGHPLLASIASPPVSSVADPLFAKGLVLLGPDNPVVLVAVDWLEIRNDAYDRWRDVLAKAVGTTRERVLVHSVHQHDAPLADLEAQRILDHYGVAEGIIDLDFHERIVQSVGTAASKSLESAQPVSHYGIGQARVEKVASNRRYLDADGKPQFGRVSSMATGYGKDQPEGLIDPWLKTLSFWNDDTPLVAVSAYATHPQSHYRTGRVSADFPGLARALRQTEMPNVPQIYVSGASGNIVAGKYNDGSDTDRQLLINRLHQAMVRAWEDTKRQPLEQAVFRSAPIKLMSRDTPNFQIAELQNRIITGRTSTERSEAAMSLSCRKSFEDGHEILAAALDLGRAQFVSLPGESYVEYQLLAQQLRPDLFVMVAGYGECAPGYIPPDKAWEEHDINLDFWSWISPGAEKPMTDAMRTILAK